MYCVFCSPKAFCDTQKVLKRRLRPGIRPGPDWGSSRRFPSPLVGWGGDTPPQSSLLDAEASTSSGSRYRRFQRLICVNLRIFFLHTALSPNICMLILFDMMCDLFAVAKLKFLLKLLCCVKQVVLHAMLLLDFGKVFLHASCWCVCCR